MVIVRFRNKEEHKDLIKKVKKMKEYAEMIEDCIAESIIVEAVALVVVVCNL